MTRVRHPARPRPRLAWRRRTLTLRTKLVALLLTLLAAAFLLVAIATTLALRDFLLDRLDAQLHSAGNRFATGLEHPDNDDNPIATDDTQFDAISGQPAGTLGARILHGTVIAAAVVGRRRDDPLIAPGSAARAVLARLPGDGQPRTFDLPSHLGDYRILVMQGDDGDLLVTGLPAHDVDETTGQLVVIEAIVFGIALALVAVAATVSVRVTLAPLTRVAETASRVADLPLSSGTVSLPERAPQTDAHTEVGTLSTAFNRMLEHVEAALHQRQQSEDRLRRFVADASHELRTPVAVIRGHAELAQRVNTDVSAEVEHSLARIEAESRRMGHLVDDLLLLARLDSGRPLAREEVDLSRLVLDAVSDARVAGPDHRWQLDLPPEPVTVVGDEHALHQVVANLLANGRTHTPVSTTVLVEVGIVHGRAEIVVGDDGPGIPDQVLPGIFDRFVRGDDNRSASTGSSGLGLAIVDAIVRAHGGTVAVESKPGRTRFTMRLGEVVTT